MNIIPIDSVGSFLKELEKVTNVNNDYFYRGENLNFKDTRLTATLYRRDSIKEAINVNNKRIYSYRSKYNYNTWRTFLRASRSFYQNYSLINNNEKENFMAVCQHHGIPTPLLDVSLSPLVALYFASQEPNDKSGRIYVFKEDYFIPLNHNILSYSYLTKCYKNNDYFPLYFFKQDSIKNLVKPVKKFISNENYSQWKYFSELLTSTINELIIYLSRNCFNHIIKDVIRQLNDYNNGFKLYKYIVNAIFLPNASSPLVLKFINFLKIFNIVKVHLLTRTDMSGNKHPVIQYYDKNNKKLFNKSSLDIFPLLLPFLLYLGNGGLGNLGPFIPSNLNFCTGCTLNWGRVKAQRSKFIVQTPFRLNKKDYNYFTEKQDTTKDTFNTDVPYIVHKPKTYCEFKVTNKYKIRKELDLIGINKMNLFKDEDSTAEYIKEKYYD